MWRDSSGPLFRGALVAVAMGSGSRGRSYPGHPFGALRVVSHADVVAFPGLGLPRQSVHIPGQPISQAARYLEPRLHAQAIPHDACPVGRNLFSEALVRRRDGGALEAPGGNARGRKHYRSALPLRPVHVDDTGSHHCLQRRLLRLGDGVRRRSTGDPGVGPERRCAHRRCPVCRCPGRGMRGVVATLSDCKAGPSARGVLHQGCRVLLLQGEPCTPRHRRPHSVRPSTRRARGGQLVRKHRGLRQLRTQRSEALRREVPHPPIPLRCVGVHAQPLGLLGPGRMLCEGRARAGHASLVPLGHVWGLPLQPRGRVHPDRRVARIRIQDCARDGHESDGGCNTVGLSFLCS
mmetsp:Transcript_93359/g.253271  ORF Transcript_93359/g.253271 Transcript_93359/m.253271 type:complete len:349 (-) Transcript_93359:217-1263(-)